MMTVITEHIPKSLLQAMQPLGADRTAKPFSLHRHFCGDGQEGVKQHESRTARGSAGITMFGKSNPFSGGFFSAAERIGTSISK
jgi:hypothetical protein